MDRIKRLEQYLFDFFSNRFDELDSFYKATHRYRRTEIYCLENGTDLMDFLISIHGRIEDRFYFESLIPHKFVSPEILLSELLNFKDYLNENQKYLDKNKKGEHTSDVIVEIQRIKDELVAMIDYVREVYDYEHTVIPYIELRHNLIVNNIPKFIETLKSILSSVSYNIAKTAEGFHHSNVHLILKLLGFDVISEEPTNTGRIDAVIRFAEKIYIIEFKFNKEGDMSKKALQQIKEKEYAQKYIIENKEIYLIGISFSNEERNINGYEYEKN
jgi:hypothetical protein